MGCGSDFVSALCPASSRLRTTFRAWFRRQMRTAGLLQTSSSAVAHQPKLRRAAKRGWSSPVARQDHNLKAAGSNPAQDQHLGGWKDGVESEIISAFGPHLPLTTHLTFRPLIRSVHGIRPSASRSDTISRYLLVETFELPRIESDH